MDFKSLENKLRQAESFQIFGHINPDGDSVGAILAMTHILEHYFGKTHVRIISRDAAPSFLSFLPGAHRISAHDGAAPAGDPVDVSLLLDCGSPRRVGEAIAPHVRNARFTVVVDHHVTNEGFGDMNLTDPDASSTCEVICRFVRSAGLTPDPVLASCLYTGIMYDTGRFIHSNTTPEVFQHCADLVREGANPFAIATATFNRRSMAHVRLLGHVMSEFKTSAGDAIAWFTMSRADFETFGAAEEDNEGIVESMGVYTGCEVHASIMELSDGAIRVSMRSTGRVNVGEICKNLGGGGHRFAAGVRLKTTLEQAEKLVLDAAEKDVARLSEGAGDGD